MRPKLPKGWSRPSSHDTLIPVREQAWRQRYCLRRGCHHLPRLTWLCIESYLATHPGSTHLEDAKYDALGPRFREFVALIGRSGLRPAEGAVWVDGAYRAYIRKMAPKILRLSTRLR